FAVSSAVSSSSCLSSNLEPGSAVPLIVLSSLVTSFTVGASGAVVSVTVVVADSDGLPALSFAVIVMFSPPPKLISVGIGIVSLPSSSAVPVAVVPSGNITVTVDPGSDVPLTVVPSLVTSFTVGTSGAVVSVTVVVADSDGLPALSFAVIVMFSPPPKLISVSISIV